MIRSTEIALNFLSLFSLKVEDKNKLKGILGQWLVVTLAHLDSFDLHVVVGDRENAFLLSEFVSFAVEKGIHCNSRIVVVFMLARLLLLLLLHERLVVVLMSSRIHHCCRSRGGRCDVWILG